MRQIRESYDIVVCGGGLAGFCAAVAAARRGARTCLVQDRPVLGGNSSSEVRVVPRGATVYHAYARETGIISELLIEERARNHEEIFENGWTNSVWDLVLYDTAVRTQNLTVHLNTSVHTVEVDARRIRSVTGRVAAAETDITLAGDIFLDCTGDGVIADLAGCSWRMGTESRHEFGEPHAPELASDDVMGNSIHIKTKDVGYPVDFTLPDWAVSYDDPEFFYQGGRRPRDVRGGYWWIEIGVPWHTIYDAERIRHELTRHALGVWDWIKNKDPRTRDLARNYALDWIGQVPGKRESRRIMGRYLMTEHDLSASNEFPDEVAYGGWNIDLHTPGGLLAPTSEPTAAAGYVLTDAASVNAYVGPFGIPLRSLIAADVDNLLMAGRNISVTHVALGSVRVQATTAVVGQAAGTAAAVAQACAGSLQETVRRPELVQQALLRDGCFLPHVSNQDPDDLARSATATASSQALLYGAGPASGDVTDSYVEIAADIERDVLHQRRGQWISVGPDGLRSVGVCLSNNSAAPVRLPATINAVESIWDYRAVPDEPLASTELTVPPGRLQWIDWAVDLPGRSGFVRLDLAGDSAVQWHRASRIVAGHVSAFEMTPGRMRRYANGVTMSFRVDPPQPCYGPDQVLTGVSRPQRSTNLWRSDPAQPLSAWLQLTWDDVRSIETIELTFAGNLAREYDSYSAMVPDPQCVRDYAIQVWADDWQTVCETTGNYQRRRQHRLPHSYRTDRIRIVVQATNGDPSAAIYEVRCY